jgi:hypothetical protein
MGILEEIHGLNQHKYLAEQLFKLLSFALKIKKNRAEIIKNKATVGVLAKRLFESVGMQSEL